MKRREFLGGLLAGAGAATLPLPSGAKAVGVAAKAKGVAAFHYGWACVYAQMNDGVTPAEVAEKFGVSMRDAHGLFDRMRARGVLHPPGLDGRSRATRPWQPWDKRQVAANEQRAREGTNQEKPRQTGRRARLKFKKFMMLQRSEADLLPATVTPATP